MSALKGVSVSKAAEGLARGLVDGAGQSVANMGGFQAILNGANSSDVMMQAAVPIFKSDNFNDTTGGVATSFGQGLGGQGVTLIAQMLGMSMSLSSNGSLTPSTLGNNSTTPASLSSTETPANNLSTPAIRARSYRSSSVIRKSAPPTSSFPKLNLHKRVDDTTQLNVSDITTGLLSGVNVTSLDVLLQKGVDTLTCQGVGGFVQIFQGLKASGSIPSTGGNTVMLPNATFTIESQGNEFLVNPATQLITVNGIGITRLTILIVAHGMFSVYLFLILHLLPSHKHTLIPHASRCKTNIPTQLSSSSSPISSPSPSPSSSPRATKSQPCFRSPTSGPQPPKPVSASGYSPFCPSPSAAAFSASLCSAPHRTVLRSTGSSGSVSWF